MKRLTIFAHYDIKGDVEDYVFYHLTHLRRHSQQLIFVSNSPVPKQSQRRLYSLCDSLRFRPNAGYDFAAWRDVILAQNMPEWDEILLTNSSIIGPLFPLDGIFSEMAGKDCDFWGLTYGVEIRPHIQSFFVCFRKQLINNEIWMEFWRSVQNEKAKADVIEKYETRFRSVFEKRGFLGDAYIHPMRRSGLARLMLHRVNLAPPVYTLRDVNRVNPTIHMPFELIEQGFPYIKAALIWGEARRQGLPIEKIMRLEKVDYDWSLLPVHPRR